MTSSVTMWQALEAILFTGYSPFVSGESSSTVDSRIKILLGKPLGIVSPEV